MPKGLILGLLVNKISASKARIATYSNGIRKRVFIALAMLLFLGKLQWIFNYFNVFPSPFDSPVKESYVNWFLPETKKQSLVKFHYKNMAAACTARIYKEFCI